MDELLKYKAYFESEWEVLSQAPATFIMLAVVSLLIGIDEHIYTRLVNLFVWKV